MVYVLIVGLCGGASRPDAQSQIIVRLAAASLIATIVAVKRWRDLRVKFLIYLSLLWTGWMVIQLIPLPPPFIDALPGRSSYAVAHELSGHAGRWRPISLSPDLTLNSIAAMLPPLAGLLALSALPPRRTTLFNWLWIGLGAASAILGIVQVATGDLGGLYTYQITTGGLPVGLLANRNHSALLLAGCLPLVACLAVGGGTIRQGPRYAVSALAGLGFVLVLLATGSRSGVVVGVILGIAALLIVAKCQARPSSKLSGPVLAIGATLALIIAGFVALSNIDGLKRFAFSDSGAELRAANFENTVVLAKRYALVGAGFGTFDPLYRGIEQDSRLSRNYFNHAHNDLLETAITAGVPGLLIVGILLAWVAMAARNAMILRDPLRVAGVSIAVGIFVASLTDYPLRTPIIGLLLVFALNWAAGDGVDSFTRRADRVKARQSTGEIAS
jgi:O-antigen ligase